MSCPPLLVEPPIVFVLLPCFPTELMGVKVATLDVVRNTPTRRGPVARRNRLASIVNSLRQRQLRQTFRRWERTGLVRHRGWMVEPQSVFGSRSVMMIRHGIFCRLPPFLAFYRGGGRLWGQRRFFASCPYLLGRLLWEEI